MIEFLSKIRDDVLYLKLMLGSDTEKLRKGLDSLQEKIDNEVVEELKRLKRKNENVKATRAKKSLIKLIKKL